MFYRSTVFCLGALEDNIRYRAQFAAGKIPGACADALQGHHRAGTPQVSGPELAAAILASLDGRLARMKWPTVIDFIAEMPRDPSGKLLKRRLRDPYWAGRDRAI
jgi:acyl-CoA synthetase (AMP-forming)/AMP-acid ligase II